MTQIIKRDGTIVEHDRSKLFHAIRKAAEAVEVHLEWDVLNEIVLKVESKFTKQMPVEQIQDLVEKELIAQNLADVAKSYILYRNERTRQREIHSNLSKKLYEFTFIDAVGSNDKRENGNIDADSSMGTMLKYGAEASKQFCLQQVIPARFAKAHADGDIHIHDMDFYPLTMTCCQHDLTKLFEGGFNTGHGYLREPQDIRTYAALACIAIQDAQNDMHGGQSCPKFDYDMAPGVAKSFIKNVVKVMESRNAHPDWIQKVKDTLTNEMNKHPLKRIIHVAEGFIAETLFSLVDREINELPLVEIETKTIFDRALQWTEKDTFQAMEAVIHNLNTMHSRAGAQVPFSSLNYGTDTTIEGRMVIDKLLDAEWAGLGNGETPIFPIHIFKVKEGVNYFENDPNYDLFEKACKVSAKRLFPNFSFLDAPFNKQFLKEWDKGTKYDPDTEVATMGCRTRVMGNNYDPERQLTCGRGNLSFTTINLPRLGLKHRGDLEGFWKEYAEMIDLVFSQLLVRLQVQSARKVKNFPFLMGQGCWIDSDKLNPEDTIEEIIKHGTLTIGFIGLAECLTALVGKHHAEDENAWKLGYEIVKFMRQKADEKSQELKLNFSVIATPAEGTSGRFVKIDKKVFGEIEGITDREYYTNSYHVPVWYEVKAGKKIQLEAPFHELCNGGHITYIELNGDPLVNVKGFQHIVEFMHDMGIGYGSINHPVDYCPICGYTGIIGDECPRCHVKEGQELTHDEIAALRKCCR